MRYVVSTLCLLVAFGCAQPSSSSSTSTAHQTDDPCPTPRGTVAQCCASPWGRGDVDPEDPHPEELVCAAQCGHHFDAHADHDYFGYDPSRLCDFLVPDEQGAVLSRVDPPSDRREFSDIAAAPVGGHCAEEGFDHIDACFNRTLPPRPHLERRIGFSRFGYDDGVAPFGYEGERGSDAQPEYRPRTGDTQILPFNRTSNDGLITLHTRVQAWPRVTVLRPERIEYDNRVGASENPDYPNVRDPHVSAESEPRASIHGLIYFDPRNTALDVDSNNPHVFSVFGRGWPDFTHATLCEDSDPASLESARNPVPCRARYGRFNFELDPSLPAHDSREDFTERDGVCYQLTLLGGAYGLRRNAPHDPHWELRSAPLTVFVPNALTCEAGNNQGLGGRVWIYPQDPEGAISAAGSDGIAVLPDYAQYDMQSIYPYSHAANQAVDIRNIGREDYMVVTVGTNSYNVPSRCFAAGLPNPNAPKWCAFLHNQRRRSVFNFDTDRDAVIDRGSDATQWDGRTNDDEVMAGANFFELITTGDGNLMVMNTGNGLFYSTNDADPCNASGFENYLPISFMPFDPEMSEYPIAHSSNGPFRDPSGQAIPPGSIQRFAYPWIDRAGTNLLFTNNPVPFDGYRHNGVERVFTERDFEGGAPPNINTQHPAEEPWRLASMNSTSGHNIGVIGGWTLGKLVIVDNGLNATDFGGRPIQDGARRYMHRFWVDLYDNGTLDHIPRDVTNISSYENELNHFDALRPTMPFDVVWQMSSRNQQNSEIVFDEYMAPAAFVVAHMNASARLDVGGQQRRGAIRLAVDHGFVPNSAWNDGNLAPGFTFNTDPTDLTAPSGRVMLQNAAGRSPVERLQVRGGARVEPVALGGVVGRGLFLDGRNDFVEIPYPAGNHHEWFMGLWIELRNFPYRGISQIATFPDGSWLGLENDNVRSFRLVAHSPQAGVTEYFPLGSLIQAQRYGHLGFRLTGEPTARSIEVLVNGTRVGTLQISGAQPVGFDLHAGCEDTCTTTISQSAPTTLNGQPVHGLRAWIDELRIYRLRPVDLSGSWFDEMICNTAYGTLVSPSELPTSHAVHRNRLSAVASRIEALGYDRPDFVCEQLVFESHDRPSDIAVQRERRACADRVHRDGSPAGCARADFLLPPVFQPLQPRPSTFENAFCTSCHDHDEPVIVGLHLGALIPSPLRRWLDPRRQPLDPPATIVTPPLSTCEPDDQRWHCLLRDRAAPHGLDFATPTDFLFDEAEFIHPHTCEYNWSPLPPPPPGN